MEAPLEASKILLYQTFLERKKGLFTIAKNRKHNHFDKVNLRECEQGVRLHVCTSSLKRELWEETKKNSLQAPSEGEIQRPVRAFPTQTLSCLSRIMQSSVKYYARNNLVRNFLHCPST